MCVRWWCVSHRNSCQRTSASFELITGYFRERWDEIRDLVCWEAVRLNRHTAFRRCVSCVSPAVCLSLCVLPRLWPIVHIFALFIFLLIPQDTHPHAHTHTYIHTCAYINIHTHCSHYARGGCESLQTSFYICICTHTDKNGSTVPLKFASCREIKDLVDLSSAVMFVNHCSLSLLCSSALKHFTCLDDFSLSRNLELVSKTHPKMVLLWGFTTDSVASIIFD